MAPPKKYFTAAERRIAGRAKQVAYAKLHYTGQFHGHVHKAPEPTPAAAIERDRALAAPRSLSQELFGDPLFGRSALDKLRTQPQAAEG